MPPPPNHYIPVLLLATIFFLVSGGCAVSPFQDWDSIESDEKEFSADQSLSMSKRAGSDYATVEDRPRILCGQALIHTLKEQCGQRGTFSPYHKREAHEVMKVARRFPDLSNTAGRAIRLRKRYDDICEVYLRYEPESPLSQCCCLGCTRAYLENFCAEA